MTRAVRVTIVVIVALASAMLSAHGARAADNGQFSIAPVPVGGAPRAVIELTANAGSTVRDRFMLTNRTPERIIFDMYTADASDDTTGAFILSSRNEPTHDVGRWVALPARRITVPGHSTFVVPFTVHVPVNATPGDHAGGVVALSRTTSSDASPSGPVTPVRHGVGVRIYLRVRGSLAPSLAIRELLVHNRVPWSGWLGGGRDMRVTFTVVNTGNVRLSPVAHVTADGIGTVHTHDTALPDLLPGASVHATTTLRGLHAVGRARVRVVARDGRTVADASESIIIVPWLLVAVVAVMLLLLGAWLRRRRRKSASAPKSNEEVLQSVSIC